MCRPSLSPTRDPLTAAGPRVTSADYSGPLLYASGLMGSGSADRGTDHLPVRGGEAGWRGAAEHRSSRRRAPQPSPADHDTRLSLSATLHIHLLPICLETRRNDRVALVFPAGLAKAARERRSFGYAAQGRSQGPQTFRVDAPWYGTRACK